MSMSIEKHVVPLRKIISRTDGKTYYFPDVDQRFEYTQDELERAFEAINPSKEDHGLRGLHLSPKLQATLSPEVQFCGLEWITNIGVNEEIEQRMRAQNKLVPRQLKLLARNRRWNKSQVQYEGDLLFRKFSIHPETGEFVGEKGLGTHANHIRVFGTHPFTEYVRLAYVGVNYIGRPLSYGVLLTRPYYNPNFEGELGDRQLDREITLSTLALLKHNGLPEDTLLLLSAPRDVFLEYGLQ